jgi:hypothetical protein
MLINKFIVVMCCFLFIAPYSALAAITASDEQRTLQNQDQIIRNQEKVFEDLKKRQQVPVEKQSVPHIT